VNRKRKLSAVFFTTDTKSFIHVTRIAATRIIYMCRLRHINDLVLSSLKMEGIRLLFLRINPLRSVALQTFQSVGLFERLHPSVLLYNL
jgi:hypothetical protein